MPLYLILILHIAAVFVLCSVLCVDGLSLAHLRAASTLAQAQPWIEPVRRLRLFAIGSVLAIQISGGYLLLLTASMDKAWPKVAMGAFPLLMIPFGNMTAKRMRAIRSAFRSKSASQDELLNMFRAPLLRISLGVRIAAFLGVFLLVSIKPGWLGSVALLAAALTISISAIFLLTSSASTDAENRM